MFTTKAIVKNQKVVGIMDQPTLYIFNQVTYTIDQLIGFQDSQLKSIGLYDIIDNTPTLKQFDCIISTQYVYDPKVDIVTKINNITSQNIDAAKNNMASQLNIAYNSLLSQRMSVTISNQTYFVDYDVFLKSYLSAVSLNSTINSSTEAVTIQVYNLLTDMSLNFLQIQLSDAVTLYQTIENNLNQLSTNYQSILNTINNSGSLDDLSKVSISLSM